MDNPIVSPAVPAKQKIDKLALVGLGLEVYDNVGKKVGKVDSLFAGASSEQAQQVRTATVLPAPVAPMGQQGVPAAAEPVVVPEHSSVTVPEFDDVLRPDHDLPKELHERLMHDGFIRIDAGIFHHHRFALRDQIERVEGERVLLNVGENELIKH